jgi:hypothetical protein
MMGWCVGCSLFLLAGCERCVGDTGNEASAAADSASALACSPQEDPVGCFECGPPRVTGFRRAQPRANDARAAPLFDYGWLSTEYGLGGGMLIDVRGGVWQYLELYELGENVQRTERLAGRIEHNILSNMRHLGEQLERGPLALSSESTLKHVGSRAMSFYAGPKPTDRISVAQYGTAGAGRRSSRGACKLVRWLLALEKEVPLPMRAARKTSDGGIEWPTD